MFQSIATFFALKTIIKFPAAMANPSLLNGGVPINQGMIRNISGDHRSGTDKYLFSNSDATTDGCIGPQGGAFFDKSLLKCMFA